jgi:glycosyltransferase involved in cell wall biosynthesis
MSTFQRIQSYLSFSAKAFWGSIRNSNPDVVYGISTPLSTAWTAAMAARWHGVPWLFEIRDLWPAFPIQMGAIPFHWLEQVLYKVERFLYRSAAHIVTMSPDMTTHVEQTGQSPDRVTTILPGSDLDYLNSPTSPSPQHVRRRYNLPASPLVLYAGTFGRANDIPTLIEVARRCKDEKFSFLFVGRGFYEPALRRLARKNSSVFLAPPQPQHHMGAWYRLADLSVVSFLDRPVLASNSPAKFFDSLTMGTPVLVTNPGWTKAFVETHQCGWYVPPSDPDSMTKRLRALMTAPNKLSAAGDRGRRVAEKKFNRSEQFSKIPALVERCVTTARGT